MKLKITIFLAAILIISTNIFGQSPVPKTTVKPPEPKTEVKTPEPKTSTVASLPTVKTIIDKYVQAIGGRDANEKIQTRVMKGTVELAPMGVKGTAEIYMAAPDKSYTKISFDGLGDFIESYDGTTGWAVNPIQGSRDKTGDELLQAKLASTFHRDTNLEKYYPKMEVRGIEKVGDKEAYVIIATPTGLEPQTLYFDKQTGLLLRADAILVSPQGKLPSKSFFDDYREIDGIKQAFKIRAILPQFEVTTTLTEIKDSVKIDDAIFSKPKE